MSRRRNPTRSRDGAPRASVTASTDGAHRLRTICEFAYRTYARPEFIHPDPLELVLGFEDVRDREVVGLFCALLALGRVEGILSACRAAISAIPDPPRLIRDLSLSTSRRAFMGFKYRFFGADEMSRMAFGIGRLIDEHGSLEASLGDPADVRAAHDILEPLTVFAGRLRAAAGGLPGILLSDPATNSAHKRLNLYLSWMVRTDAVSPGGWATVRPGQLLVPVDTHMLRIARAFGITRRTTADITTVREITAAFRSISPDDPVKYDFALTRLGINPGVRRGDVNAAIEQMLDAAAR